jgi:hypothetical protein
VHDGTLLSGHQQRYQGECPVQVFQGMGRADGKSHVRTLPEARAFFI